MASREVCIKPPWQQNVNCDTIVFKADSYQILQFHETCSLCDGRFAAAEGAQLQHCAPWSSSSIRPAKSASLSHSPPCFSPNPQIRNATHARLSQEHNAVPDLMVKRKTLKDCFHNSLSDILSLWNNWSVPNGILYYFWWPNGSCCIYSSKAFLSSDKHSTRNCAKSRNSWHVCLLAPPCLTQTVSINKLSVCSCEI